MIEYIQNLNRSAFTWAQHSSFSTKKLQTFCGPSFCGPGFSISNRFIFTIKKLLEQLSPTAECLRGSYFCESDFKNNFTIRRQPDYYVKAIAACENENSYLTSSNSTSDMDYAKTGFEKSILSWFRLWTTESDLVRKWTKPVTAPIRFENDTYLDKCNDIECDSRPRWQSN